MIFGRVKDFDFGWFVEIQSCRQISLPKTLISHQNLFQNRCFIVKPVAPPIQHQTVSKCLQTVSDRNVQQHTEEMQDAADERFNTAIDEERAHIDGRVCLLTVKSEFDI